MNDPGNAQPPAAGWLFPHEWQEPGEPMNGDSDECDYQARFTITTRQRANKLIEQVEARGIECRIQHLFDCDQVCIHLYGNNAPAQFFSPNQFLAWAPLFLESES
jgi:hypothetical protein